MNACLVLSTSFSCTVIFVKLYHISHISHVQILGIVVGIQIKKRQMILEQTKSWIKHGRVAVGTFLWSVLNIHKQVRLAIKTSLGVGRSSSCIARSSGCLRTLPLGWGVSCYQETKFWVMTVSPSSGKFHKYATCFVGSIEGPKKAGLMFCVLYLMKEAELAAVLTTVWSFKSSGLLLRVFRRGLQPSSPGPSSKRKAVPLQARRVPGS